MTQHKEVAFRQPITQYQVSLLSSEQTGFSWMDSGWGRLSG